MFMKLLIAALVGATKSQQSILGGTGLSPLGNQAFRGFNMSSFEVAAAVPVNAE